MADVSVAVGAKRKRGRPRKDSNLSTAATLPSQEYSSLMRNQGAYQLMYPTPAAADATKKCPDSDKNCTSDDGMVGSMVYGVVEGSFDAGYLISVRIGNNLTPFRGVIFQPRKVVAVAPVNDVAPQAKMFQRREIPVRVYEDQIATLQAPVVRPLGNLRMVEEDEVMQAFEVSTSSGGSKCNLANKGDTNNQEQPNKPPSNLQMCHNATMASALEAMDQLKTPQVRQTNLFQDVNFLSDHHQSPNLELDLAFTVHKEKQMAEAANIYSVFNPNIGFQQALVAGNPLLLPPDLIGEPLQFMMDKPKTPPSSQETNIEVQSRLVGSGDS